MKTVLLSMLISTSVQAMISNDLVVAVQQGDKDLVVKLVEESADINALIALNERDKRTALIEACKAGHADIVLILLEHGADSDRRGSREFVLQVAVKHKHSAIVCLLLKKQANPLMLLAEREFPVVCSAGINGDEDTCLLLLLWKLFSESERALKRVRTILCCLTYGTPLPRDVRFLILSCRSLAGELLAAEAESCTSLSELRQRLFKAPHSNILRSWSPEKRVEALVDYTWEGAQNVCSSAKRSNSIGGHRTITMGYEITRELTWLLHYEKLENFRETWQRYLEAIQFSRLDGE